MDTYLGNKLISDFMGDRFVGFLIEEQLDSRGTDDLLFHCSWDWLMPVVVKAREICKEKENEFKGKTLDLDNPKGWRFWSYISPNLSTDIDYVFNQCTNFIVEYNKTSFNEIP